MTEIEITGMDEVRRKIDQLKDLRPARGALLAAGEHIKGKIDRYPAATEANSPAQRRWYERGYGPRWRRKDGSLGGRKTSETLGRKWTVKASASGLVVTVGNNVSYSIYVHDADHQAAFHKRRGWPTAQGVVEQEGPTVIRFIESELKKALGE